MLKSPHHSIEMLMLLPSSLSFVLAAAVAYRSHSAQQEGRVVTWNQKNYCDSRRTAKIVFMCSPTGHDKDMQETYDMLAERAVTALRDKKTNGSALWIGLVGGPGSGKTTLADAVVDRIQNLGVDAIAVPMDGYHYSKAELAERDFKMSRRGAPWTFDAEKLWRDLSEAKENGSAGLPGYSREISDPVPDQVRLEPKHKIVLVEGNYLLLGSLLPEVDVDGSGLMEAASDMECPRSLKEEIERWKPVTELWDETWFIAPAGGFEEQRSRLIERGLATWTPAKTEAYGGGTDREAATRKVEYNDSKNAKLVNCCRSYADIAIDSV